MKKNVKRCDRQKSWICSIHNFKLFVPLVKVIVNSMPEQNLHQLNFRKRLKLWHSTTPLQACKSWWWWEWPCVLILGSLLQQVNLLNCEIVRYRVKLEWWIKFQLERSIWTCFWCFWHFNAFFCRKIHSAGLF